MIKADLNLLRVFDILMEVRSVSRAADRLGLTQSAVSHALARLRDQINDPLFLRQHGGLRPTPRANEIAPGIRDGLNRLRDAISAIDFDPGSTTRTFTISASSYFHFTLLPILMPRLRREAPGAGLRVVPPAIDLRAGFEDGLLDLALGSFGRFPSYLTKTSLFSDDLVWVGRAGSGGIEGRPRLSVAAPLFAEATARDGGERRIDRNPTSPFPLENSVVTVHDLLSADLLIADSDLITLWPRRLVALAARRSAIAMLAPSDHPHFQFAMLWPTRLATNDAHAWLRRLIVESAAEMQGA